MGERMFWLLLLVFGVHAPLRADGAWIVAVPAESELTNEVIQSERLHTGSVSATLAHPGGAGGFGTSTDGDRDNPAAFNLAVFDTINLNKIVDEMLDTLRVDIIERGKDRLSIPDVHRPFKKKIGFITVKGEFDGQNGWVKNLSTVHRTADAVASSSGSSISVSCGFGFGDLELGYDDYTARCMSLTAQGDISGTVANNSILLNATVTWTDNKCNIALDELTLNQFEGFDLKVTGVGYMNWLLSKISNLVLRHFQSEIKDRLEYMLREETEKYLSGFNCSSYLNKP